MQIPFSLMFLQYTERLSDKFQFIQQIKKPGCFHSLAFAFWGYQRAETYLCSVLRTAPGPAYSSATMPSIFSPRPSA